ncbi:MAG: hypothetical protein M3R25_10295 [Bacteroidota bacterium]|nr:hypothetical protein [Bacteroidota bacterium]
MALSSVTQLTQAQYRELTITPFQLPPKIQEEGNPDPDVMISLSGWVGENVLAFIVNNNDATIIDITPDPEPSSTTLNLNVSETPSAGSPVTYWTVNCGTDGKSADWTVTYTVKGKGSTGKWVFVKGKVGDDKPY